MQLSVHNVEAGGTAEADQAFNIILYAVDLGSRCGRKLESIKNVHLTF